MQAITVENLVVEYTSGKQKSFRAVDDLSFHVEEGEVVGFLGVNGAGKTSTLKALMGFQPINAGKATLLGRNVSEAHSRDEIGFLPETALYSPYLTPHETLWFYGQLHGMDGPPLNNRIEELLEQVGIAAKARVQNRTLSKGMLQRVGIAQALLRNPRLLILDEVSSGLDPIGRRDLRNLLRQQQQEGVTVFFSSHQLGEVELLCDRIVVIHQGRLIAEHTMSRLKGEVTSLEDYFVSIVETGTDPILAPASSAEMTPILNN